ncbi:MAG: hypothetical protein ACRCXD_08565 [Luteolibacter sp.]
MSEESLGCLLQLIWLPYRIWQAMSGESRLGTSEMDQQVGRFWKMLAVIVTIMVILGVVAWIYVSAF